MSALMLVAHPEQTAAQRLAERVRAQLVDAGHTVAWPDRSDGHEVRADQLDYVIALGGDGTMLHAVYRLDGEPVPILGINMGRLGYLTEIEPEHVDVALDRLLAGPDAGRWTIDERMMLDVVVRDVDGAMSPTYRALNEAVVEKQESGHTVHLLVSIDGEPFTSYAADGMIVSTPTGSTAYSMSARGPIVSPKHRAVLLTPVAPHMLFDRSLVLDPSEAVSIEVVGDRDAAVAVDGRFVAELQPGATVDCRPSASVARFVRFGEARYHQVLKTKFGLADR